MEARALGPTGEFGDDSLPDLQESEGGLAFSIGTHQGRVIINFGASVAWLGLTPDQADEMAQALAGAAETLKS